MPGTIGKTTTGSSSAETADNWQNECTVGASFRYTASAGESVTSVRVRGEGTGVCEVGVYVWNGSVPTTLIGSATINVGASDAEYSTAVDWDLTNGVTYVAAIDYTASIGALWTMHYEVGAGANSISANQDALEATWTQSSTSNDLATYWAVVEGASNSAAITLNPFTTSASGTVELLPYVVTSNVAALTASDDPSVTFTGYTPVLNDLVILFVSSTAIIAIQANASLPSGWVNPLGDGVEINSDSHGMCVAYHLVTSGEVSGATTTYTATNLLTATHTGRVHGVVVRNHDVANPIDGFGSTQNSTNTVTPHVLASITGSGVLLDDSLVISSAAADGTGTYGTPPTGWTMLQTAGTTQGRWTGTRDTLTTVNTDVTATNITPSAGDEYVSITLAVAKTVEVTGTVAETLDPFTTSTSGTVTDPPISGSSAITLAPFTTTASGTFNPGAITGTAAITLGSFDVHATQHDYPVSVSGRKIISQTGGVSLILTASCWSLADLSNANITSFLEGMSDAGFNGVTVWAGGGYHINSTWEPEYERKSDSSDWWTGTPWASTFGTAWNAMDHIADETLRLGMVLSFSICGGFDTTGAGPEWEAATNTNLHDVGVAVATRYPIEDYPNIIWHLMLDDANSTASTRGQRADAYFDGINDTEGASTRPVRWMEPANGATVNSQGWLNTGSAQFTVNAIYEYSDSHVVEIEAGYADATAPLADCEPPYDGSPNAGASHIGLRSRTASIFIEGGCLINWGHEDMWPFGKTGLFTEGIAYTAVPTHASTLHAGFIFGLMRTYVADLTWAPTSSFIDNGATGEGTGGAKAAQGASDTAALAFFPDSRTITVATSILAGTGHVRLRWFDPTDGTFDLIDENEAQQAGRSVTHPGNTSNSAGSSDWILVVDEAPGDAQAAITLAPFTTTASGTFTPVFTGTVAETLDPFISTASGTVSAPNITGTAAITLGSFTPTASGKQGETGTVARTLNPFTTTASGLFIPAGSGAAAITLAPFITSASGTAIPPTITGTAAITLGSFIVQAFETALTNITVVVGVPTIATRSVTHDTIDRQVGANNTVDRASGIPDMVDRSASHDMVDRDANDPDTKDRSATIALGHGSPDPPTF